VIETNWVEVRIKAKVRVRVKARVRVRVRVRFRGTLATDPALSAPMMSQKAMLKSVPSIFKGFEKNSTPIVGL
jgi:hypothetical protein